MTVRFWVALAALPVICVGCSSEPGAESPTAGRGGQQATAGAGSGGGGAAGTAGSGGQSGSAPGGSGGVSAGAGGTAGSGGSAGSAGSGGSAGATGGPVTPTEAAGLYTFTYGDVIFAVDAMVAGRITTFSKGGTNVLDDGDGINYSGSTLWPAPEADFQPLAPAGIDSEPFTATLQGATLVLTGPVDAVVGLSATKSFTVDSALDRVEIVYTLKNEDTGPQSVAAWEVTRLAQGGISFFPAPTAGELIEGYVYTYDAVGHISWTDHADEVVGLYGKLRQDGEGWAAHAQDSLLFMKTFPDLQPSEFAGLDTEVEIYVNPDLMYIELENVGALTELAAGASLTYTTHWYLRTIPGTVTVATESPTLFEFAAALAQ